MSQLANQDFMSVVEHAPLVSIDLFLVIATAGFSLG